jgi:4-methylaminobutanoate oxidase (formaldehyde-forming)
VWQLDAARFHRYQNNLQALSVRVPEVLADTYNMPWPGKDHRTARQVRRTPFYALLKQRGAYMTQRAGWERPNWFSLSGDPGEPELCYGRPAWFNNWAQEHRAAREGVAIFDQSPFAKLLIQGRDAETLLQRLCANDIAVAPGKVVYTTMLNEIGGIESDFTLTRIDETSYFMITGSQQARRDAAWIRRHIREDEHAVVTDVTSAYAALAITGPQSRELLSQSSSANFSNATFPFGTSQEIEVGLGLARALRVSYAGELGWELYIPTDLAEHVFETIMESSAKFDLRLGGAAALGSLRLEKAFRSWGHDIGPMDTPAEAGLMFGVRLQKRLPFIGRDAVLRQQDEGVTRRLVGFVFADGEAFPYGTEAIFRNGSFCGSLSSASFGHTFGTAVGLGWVRGDSMQDEAILRDNYEVEVNGRCHQAKAYLSAPYDPKGQRLRS